MHSEIKNLSLICPDCNHQTKIGDIEVIIQRYNGYEPGPYEDWEYSERHLWVCENCTSVIITTQKEHPFNTGNCSFNSFVKEKYVWYSDNKTASGRVKELLKPSFKRDFERREQELKQFRINEAKRLLEMEGVLEKQLTVVE